MYAVYNFFQDRFPLDYDSDWKIYGLYANVWDSLVGPCLQVYMYRYMLFKAYGPRFNCHGTDEVFSVKSSFHKKKWIISLMWVFFLFLWSTILLLNIHVYYANLLKHQSFFVGWTLKTKTSFRFDSPVWLMGKFYHIKPEGKWLGF